MRNTHLLALSLITFPCVLMAQTTIQPEPVQLEKMRPKSTELTPTTPSTANINVNEQDLLANPALLAQFLDKAVESNNWQAVAIFLPLYEKTTQPDRTLLEYARAGLLRSQGQYAKAIEQYRGIISRQPEFTPVRMTLAVTLFDSHQDEAARFQFEKVRADKPPDDVLKTIDLYLTNIRQRSGWRVDGGINYVTDNNVNNASSDKIIKIGYFVSQPRSAEDLPQSAQGVAYFANVARDVYVADQHALTAAVNVNGKNYWDNHRYDEQQARVNLGYKWQDGRHTLSATPFYQMRRFGNAPYSSSYGSRGEWSYLISPRWQSALALEYTENRYETRKYLNGRSMFASVGAMYSPNARATIFGGVDVLKDVTRDASESSKRASVRLGVAYDLPWDLSFSAQASVGRRVFKNVPSFFGIQRKDTQVNYSVTMWHRRLYFWGVMPKLTWSYEAVNSNINLNTYRKSKVFVSLDKRF